MKTGLYGLAVIFLISFSSYSQTLNNSYVLKESYSEFEEKYTFNSNHQFTYFRQANHSSYSGKGYYALSQDSLFLFYENQVIDNESAFKILSSTPEIKEDLTLLLIVVNDNNDQPIVPIVTCNNQPTVVEKEKISLNSVKVRLKNVNKSDSITIISPGYKSLDLSLYNFKNKESAILVNLRFIDNNYLIEGGPQVFKIKRNKSGFVLKKPGISKEFVKKE